MTAFPTYSTGTVSVAANATAIVGVGMDWTTKAVPGDTIQVTGFAPVKTIDVTDATHLAIAAWPFGTVAAGTTYTLFLDSPSRSGVTRTMQNVDTLIAAINSNGFYVAVPPTAAAPDPSLGEENQYAIQAGTGKIWQRIGGAWVFVDALKGFGSFSAWSSTTAYTERDVASLNGTTYVCILANTNQTPPNATYWMVLAAKGDTGATGATGPVALKPVAAWVTATAYIIGPPASFVSQAGSSYECLVAHTSGTFATDLAAGKWGVVASKGVDGSGIGDMLKSDNLAGLANVGTARTNLGATTIGNAVFTAADAPTARSVVGVPGQNIIINGDFRVNQAGYVSAATLAAGAYGHDQWKAGASGGNYSFTQLKSSTQITIASGKSLIQPIEDANVIGGSYVLSWAGTAQARAGVNTLTPSGTFVSSPLLITGQTAGTVMSVEFSAGTLGTVKLESGTVATPFIMRPITEEMLMCRRYLQFTAVYNRFAATGTANNDATGVFSPSFRVAPTLAIVAAGIRANIVGANVDFGDANYGSFRHEIASGGPGDAFAIGDIVRADARL
jgi:hypothetical protein